MLSDESLRAGDVEEALKQLQDRIRNDPSDSKLRIFLFQLLAIDGQWDRALTQLNLSGEMDAANLPMVQTYRETLQCEVLRHEVFAGKRSPLVFGEPQQWVALLIEAVRLGAEGQYAQSQAVRAQAFDAAPATAGRIDEQPFEWIADADPRLGPVLEAIVNGRYYWVPIQNIHSLEMEAPEDLRDLVWMPATFTWTNGGSAVGFIPSRYPNSHASDDGTLRLARKTEWIEIEQAADLYHGLGQRVIATDADEYPLLQIRSIAIGDAPEETVAVANGSE